MVTVGLSDMCSFKNLINPAPGLSEAFHRERTGANKPALIMLSFLNLFDLLSKLFTTRVFVFAYLHTKPGTWGFGSGVQFLN